MKLDLVSKLFRDKLTLRKSSLCLQTLPLEHYICDRRPQHFDCKTHFNSWHMFYQLWTNTCWATCSDKYTPKTTTVDYKQPINEGHGHWATCYGKCRLELINSWVWIDSHNKRRESDLFWDSVTLTRLTLISSWVALSPINESWHDKCRIFMRAITVHLGPVKAVWTFIYLSSNYYYSSC